MKTRLLTFVLLLLSSNPARACWKCEWAWACRQDECAWIEWCVASYARCPLCAEACTTAWGECDLLGEFCAFA